MAMPCVTELRPETSPNASSCEVAPAPSVAKPSPAKAGMRMRLSLVELLTLLS